MRIKHLTLLVIYFSILIWSGINPHDYLTWFLEVIPGIIGFLILLFTYKKFRFTYLTYILILLHCFILFWGGKYTYAHNPLFDWIKEMMSLDRNNYDKVGHFAQGFVPTLIAREILIRKEIIKQRSWLWFILIGITSFITVTYELLEWFVALIIKQNANEFLGMQGYVWDTQSDMLYALIGSICAIFFLSKLHDKYLKQRIDKLDI